MGCMTKAVYEYYDRNPPQPSMRAETAISVHQEEDLYNFEPSNKIVGPPIIMDWKDDLHSAVEEAKRAMAPMKDQKFILCMSIIINFLLNYVPNFLFEKMLGDEMPKKSLSCSNMAGPRMQKWKFQGKTAHWVSMTTCHYIPEVTFTSMHDTCKLTISGDASKFKDFKQLLTLMQKELLSDE